MCVVQELRATDYEQREDFAIRMQVLLEENENAIIIMSDEAHFNLSGEVNKQNLRYWANENPLNIHEKPLHSERVTVWCAIGIFGIIGPYFFEDENGATVTVNAERYIHMLNTFLRPQKTTSTQHAKCLFSTGWCHPTHCTIVNGRGSSHVSRKGHFTFRRHPVAHKVP